MKKKSEKMDTFICLLKATYTQSIYTATQSHKDNSRANK